VEVKNELALSCIHISSFIDDITRRTVRKTLPGKRKSFAEILEEIRPDEEDRNIHSAISVDSRKRISSSDQLSQERNETGKQRFIKDDAKLESHLLVAQRTTC